LAASRALRSPLAVTLAVWKALFMREALSRLAQDRIAWVWLVVEPIAHVSVFVAFIAIGLRQRSVAGADVSLFFMLGVLAFFMPRNILNRALDAIEPGEALYAFRQVLPVDTVLVRAVVEGLLELVILATMLAAAGLLHFPVIPADPLGALYALGALWLAGLGLGLALSVLGTLVSEIARVTRLLLTPLYFMSAVLFPSIAIPLAFRDVLMLNPLLHGIEALRVAFMPGYVVPPGIDVGYLVQFATVMIFIGLALHMRYQPELKAK
jgi:capsular polysaccharide transport system permease protein